MAPALVNRITLQSFMVDIVRPRGRGTKRSPIRAVLLRLLCAGVLPAYSLHPPSPAVNYPASLPRERQPRRKCDKANKLIAARPTDDSWAVAEKSRQWLALRPRQQINRRRGLASPHRCNITALVVYILQNHWDEWIVLDALPTCVLNRSHVTRFQSHRPQLTAAARGRSCASGTSDIDSEAKAPAVGGPV
jgi:hypothetical protein